jgi:isopentenyl-diphosphate delta-isomerase type 2
MSSGRQKRKGSSERKEKHLTICTDPSRFRVEGAGAGFAGVRFLHEALPEIAVAELDTSAEFLGTRVALPLFISCMTGGSEGGFRANRVLAEAAESLGVPVGLGSIRVLLEEPDLFHHFDIKPLAPSVPVLANIGAVQVRDGDRDALLRMSENLRAAALVVHLNPGQELFQEEGDRDFRGLKRALHSLIEDAPLPVIVKETGFGISPPAARELLDAGAAYVDLAGAGGTNWISVESYRLSGEDRSAAEEFTDWGMPTALLLAAFDGAQPRLLASGGIRTGMDAAKSLAMGAELVGLALPAIREAVTGGAQAVVSLFRRLERTLRAVMVMTGSRTVADLRRGTIWRTPEFEAEVAALRQAWGAPRRAG